MATLFPIRALRPVPAEAAAVAAVPYDVVSTDEARALADGNPLSFLRVSRPEIELPPDTDPHGDPVYARAAQNFQRLKQSALVRDDGPAVYFYRLRRGDHEQTGLAAGYSVDEYDRNVIKKHERTRRDKEDDRTRHIKELGAQTGPVFLVYRQSNEIEAAAARAVQGPALYDFTASDAVRHTVWRVGERELPGLIEAVGRLPALYIADGHHRAASAARAWHDRGATPAAAGAAGPGAAAFLAVAFPHDQVRILPYNRIVRDLGRQTPVAFLAAVGERFEIGDGPAVPARRGDIAMYHGGRWRTLRSKAGVPDSDPIRSLDVSVLQDHLLDPILGIVDVRSDTRIDFVGGARGVGELARLVDAGQAAVAFSLHPVSVDQLMAVSDQDAIMPPKSTWFEPKLRDGLLIHTI